MAATDGAASSRGKLAQPDPCLVQPPGRFAASERSLRSRHSEVESSAVGDAHDIGALKLVLTCTPTVLNPAQLKTLRAQAVRVDKLARERWDPSLRFQAGTTSSLLHLAQDWAVRRADEEREADLKLAAAVREYELFLLPLGADPEVGWTRLMKGCTTKRANGCQGPKLSPSQRRLEFPMSDTTWDQTLLLRSIERLARLEIPAELAPRLILIPALLAYDHNRLELAREGLERLLRVHPHSDEAARALPVLVDLLSAFAFRFEGGGDQALRDVVQANTRFSKHPAWSHPAAAAARETLPSLATRANRNLGARGLGG